MSSTKRPRTERWIVARHVDRILGLVVQPAYDADVPPDQYEAAVAQAVKGLIAIAAPHAGKTMLAGWLEACEEATGPEDLMDVLRSVYATLWGSGLLRPSPLEEEDV